MKLLLVGLDGSERAPAVLEAAISIARAQGAKLVLFRAIGLPPDMPTDVWKLMDEPLLDVLNKRSRAYLEAMATRAPKELLERTEVAVGVPWQAICDAAKRDQVDLVVVGSHGYAGLDRLLGTTAAKVVNHAGCSVLVVR
jgi:universal stress protein F